MSEAQGIFSDPAMADLLEVAERTYTGSSSDHAVEAVISGSGIVTTIRVLDASLPVGAVSTQVVEALNSAHTGAREATRAALATLPGISAQTRAVLTGASESEAWESAGNNAGDASHAARAFTGREAEAYVTFDNRTQQFTEAYVPDLGERSAAQLVKAANRAVAAAEIGREGAVGLDEQIDDRISQLDEEMDRIGSRLDDVLAELQGILGEDS